MNWTQGGPGWWRTDDDRYRICGGRDPAGHAAVAWDRQVGQGSLL